MNLLAIIILGILISMVIGLLGIYLVPKMSKDLTAEDVWGAMAVLFFFQIGFGIADHGFSTFMFGQSIGFCIPLVIGSYLITIIKRSGTTEIEKAFTCPEMGNALVANVCLGALITINNQFFS